MNEMKPCPLIFYRVIDSDFSGVTSFRIFLDGKLIAGIHIPTDCANRFEAVMNTRAAPEVFEEWWKHNEPQLLSELEEDEVYTYEGMARIAWNAALSSKPAVKVEEEALRLAMQYLDENAEGNFVLYKEIGDFVEWLKSRRGEE